MFEGLLLKQMKKKFFEGESPTLTDVENTLPIVLYSTI